VVNTLLLRPLPVGNPGQLVKLYTLDTRSGKQPNSYLNFVDYAKDNAVFSAVSAYQFVALGLTKGGETSNIFGQLVNGNYFSMLEVSPALGRGFLPEEDTKPDGHPVVVLNHRFWQKLGGDPGIIGSSLTLNGHSFTVVGIAPPHFNGTDVGVAPDLWVPMAMHGGSDRPGPSGLRIVAR